MLCFYLLHQDGGRITLNQGGFLRLNQDCIPIAVGVRRRRDRPLDTSGIREIFDFWKSYFLDIVKLSEADAVLRAEEMTQIALNDDEDMLMLI